MSELLDNKIKIIELKGKKYKFTTLTLGQQADFKKFCKEKKKNQVLDDLKDLGEISAKEKYDMIQLTDSDMIDYYSEPDGLSYLLYLALKEHNQITLEDIQNIDFSQEDLMKFVGSLNSNDEVIDPSLKKKQVTKRKNPKIKRKE